MSARILRVPTHRIFAFAALMNVLSACASAALLLLVLTGCTTTPVDVVQAAETLEQRAYATYGVFVVYEEQGAALVTDDRTPDAVVAAIKAADAKAKPLADSMLDAALAAEQAREDLAAGKTGMDKLLIASSNLKAWLANAVPAVQRLIAAVKGGN